MVTVRESDRKESERRGLSAKTGQIQTWATAKLSAPVGEAPDALSHRVH